MTTAATLGRFSFGVGDRFAREAVPQLCALMLAARDGVEVTPVWNKSNREHTLIGSKPLSVRAAAARAAAELGWTKPWHVDADHIRLETVDAYLDCSDFFTIDVADFIGKAAPSDALRGFLDRHPELAGPLSVPGIAEPLGLNRAEVSRVAANYLFAIAEARRIYRHIAAKRGEGKSIIEVSMDETDAPQTPLELLVILAALADEGVPVQTIAPKFTGRFNKGVDFVGDVAQFEREFNDDLAVIAYAVNRYGLPANLKLSVHSGSDKFSLYPIIRRALAKSGAGVHVKTAGTTWLEELIGLAESGGDGLALAKEIYGEALDHFAELVAPYGTVIDIDQKKLPSPAEVRAWTATQFASALRHDQRCPDFNPHVRQLLHVSFKIAAKMGDRYLKLLDSCRPAIERNVTANLYLRHLKPLFIG